MFWHLYSLFAMAYCIFLFIMMEIKEIPKDQNVSCKWIVYAIYKTAMDIIWEPGEEEIPKVILEVLVNYVLRSVQNSTRNIPVLRHNLTEERIINN